MFILIVLCPTVYLLGIERHLKPQDFLVDLPIELYENFIAVPKSNLNGLNDEAKIQAKRQNYPIKEGKQLDLQCFNYSGCIVKADEIISSRGLKAKAEPIQLNDEELRATVMYTLNLYSEFNNHTRKYADGTLTSSYTYGVFYYVLMSAVNKFEAHQSKSEKKGYTV